MIRLIGYVIASLIVAAGAAWLIGLPGTLSIEVAGYRMQPSLGLAIAALIVLVLAVILVWAIVRRVLEAPRRMARANVARRQKAGVSALSDGFIALQAGDPGLARSLAREAKGKLSDNLAAQLLEARADLALGDMNAAREHYRGLIANPKTAMAALSGLYEQARAQGRQDAALTFARKAVKIAPSLGWAQGAVFDDLAQKRAWDEALELVSAQPAPKWQDREAKKRQQAVLHTAMAQDAEASDPAKALEHATAALKLVPDFVPAGLISARVHIDRGESRKAQSLLRRLWRSSGHPHVAMLFAHSQPGASAVDRLKKVRQLIEGQPGDVAAAMVLARAAVDAYEWETARKALGDYLDAAPSQGVCLLMAEIEEGQSGDQGKAREWLARAVKAPRDPAWVADGVVSDEWEPVSPITGKLDAFRWTVPDGGQKKLAAAGADGAALPAGTGAGGSGPEDGSEGTLDGVPPPPDMPAPRV